MESKPQPSGAVQPWDISLSPWAARLDAEDKDYALAMEIGERRACKEKEWDIARHKGVTRGQLRMWLKATPERWAAFCAGYEALADERAEETIEIADNTEGDVQRDALRVKARQWYAERAGRGKWSSNAPISVPMNSGGFGGGKIEIVFVDARAKVIEHEGEPVES